MKMKTTWVTFTPTAHGYQANPVDDENRKSCDCCACDRRKEAADAECCPL